MSQMDLTHTDKDDNDIGKCVTHVANRWYQVLHQSLHSNVKV